VTLRHRRSRAQPAVDGGGGEGVTALALFPEVGGRTRNAVVLDRAEQELRRAPRRRPQVAVERLVAQRAPGRFVREQRRAGLVELVLAPRRR
jgi:hypothetical protein